MSTIANLPATIPAKSGAVLAKPDLATFVDVEGRSNTPSASLANARIALYRLGLNCWHDLFTDKKYVGGMALNSEVGSQVTDDVVAAIRVMIRNKFAFDPGKNHMWDAINLVCREHGIHPVQDYLNECFETWHALDHQPRIDNMLRDYFKAPDTPLVRAMSRLIMVASVRRIFEPGCKFDYMIVLESPEGYEKSSGIAALYGREWFSDQTILGLDDKHLAETVRGRWALECADLSGMKKAEVEKVKAQLSRFTDRTRPAYGRAVIDAARSCVFWGTTNDREYLRSQTGNRRFLMSTVGRIDVAAIERDRDLLWGEAVALHRSGHSIALPPEFWQLAAVEQEQRTISDPWADRIPNASKLAQHYQQMMNRNDGAIDTDEAAALGVVYQNDGTEERITSAYLLAKVIGIPPDRQTAEHGKRLGTVMRREKWDGPKSIWLGRPIKGYSRAVADMPAEPEPWDA